MIFKENYMKCGECIFARTDDNDDEDIYGCPFDLFYCFHSGEECCHKKDYIKMLIPLRKQLKLYDNIRDAINEEYLYN